MSVRWCVSNKPFVGNISEINVCQDSQGNLLNVIINKPLSFVCKQVHVLINIS